MGRKLLLPSAGTFFLHLFTLCRIPFIAIWQKGYYEVQMSVFCKRLLFEFQTMILEPLVLNARGYVLTLNISLQYASWKIVICPFNVTVSRNNKYKSSKVKFTCDWRLFINSSTSPYYNSSEKLVFGENHQSNRKEKKSRRHWFPYPKLR